MSEPTKILHVISNLGPGGAEKVVLDLAEIQVANGNEVAILSPSDVGVHQVRSTPEGVQMRFLHAESTASEGKKFSKYYSILNFIIKNRDWLREFEVVHLHLTFGAIFGWIFRFLKHNKLQCLIETNHSAGMPMNRVIRRIRVEMTRRFDLVVLVVEDAFWQYEAKRKNLQLEIVPNGIDSSKYSGLTRERPTSPSFVVGTVGMLRADRKPWIFTEIFEEVSNRLSKEKVSFLIVGDGPLREKLNNIFEEKGMTDQVEFFGVSSFPAQQAIEMNVFVSLNVGPLTGMAAIEASFAGVPLVGFQMDPAYQTQAQDWIWSSDNPKEVADQIVTLLNDNKKLNQLTSDQSSHVQANHSLQSVYEQYQNLYRSRSSRKIG
jgi:glycosyltransferase involved in cell wall biosynthesis